MRTAPAAVAVAVLWLLPLHGADQATQRPKLPLDDPRRSAAITLVQLVDAVSAGQMPGGDAWLRWHHHFLKAPNGRVYVPFTLEIEEAGGGFESIIMYVRAVRRSDESLRPADSSQSDDMYNGLLWAIQPTSPKYAFEGVDEIEITETQQGRHRIQRALILRPGHHDIYIAVGERQPSGSPGGTKSRSTVLKESLTVPDFLGTGLRTSGIILAERVSSLPIPLLFSEQRGRPYALGSVEIVPAPDARFMRGEALSIVFFIYGARMKGNAPDVTVNWRFFRETGVSETTHGQMPPERFNTTIGRQGSLDQLLVSQAVPLDAFPAGAYRAQIEVTDHLARRTSTDEVRFTVSDALP